MNIKLIQIVCIYYNRKKGGVQKKSAENFYSDNPYGTMSTQYIDETAFVQAEQGKTNLMFSDEKQQARFELGVSMVIYKWDALDVAVENSWGGPDSAEKRDWITGIVVDLFKNEKVVDAALIEETLLYAMIDEFETNVEDDSALPIAVEVINIYNDCFNLNYNKVENLYLEWQEKQRTKKSKRVVHIEGDDDEEDEDEEDYDDEDEDEEMDEVVSDLVSSKPEPIVDEDGFELVQPKGRRKH
ncbi:rRNA accumulation- protein [Saccharomyces cerevisiae]|nr:protein with a potential role in pre-rRNA processing [Saccharomyces cerevisiae]GHM88933.1 rRNA accumulation- protein [Saccharomyces cerevisiae]CAI4654817.1 CLN_G0039160.mRNA.1.CDS.1 [Saccharomyces cerevisiae]CAI7417874.1 CLN_G0039160.mRNA.1.CDS.1 [Saccharomyces cerevisiae]